MMKDFRLVVEVPVRFADTDALGHVNNAHYLSFMEAARIEYLARVLGARKVEDFGVILARAEVDYKSPAFHHETLLVGCRTDEVGGASIKMSYRMEDKATGRLVAEGKAVIVRYDYALGRPTRVGDDWRRRMDEFEGGVK